MMHLFYISLFVFLPNILLLCCTCNTPCSNQQTYLSCFILFQLYTEKKSVVPWIRRTFDGFLTVFPPWPHIRRWTVASLLSSTVLFHLHCDHFLLNYLSINNKQNNINREKCKEKRVPPSSSIPIPSLGDWIFKW